MSLSLQPPSNLDLFLFPVADFGSHTIKSVLSALELAGLGIAYWDFHDRIVYWSKELAEFHGVLSGQFHRVYREYLHHICPSDRFEFRTTIEHVKTTLEGEQIDYRINVDNQERWLRSSFSPGIKDGRLTHIIEIVSDISELKAAQMGVVAVESHWQKLLGCVSDVILETTLSGEIISATNSITSLWGYHLDELRGINLNSVVELEDVSLDLSVACHLDCLPLSAMASVLHKYHFWKSTQCTIHSNPARQTLFFVFKPFEQTASTFEMPPQFQTAIASVASSLTYHDSVCSLRNWRNHFCS